MPMTRTVAEVCQRGVVRIDATESIAEAASIMRYEEIGAVAVFEHDAMIGILTERDVVRAVAEGILCDETAAAEYMTAEPVTVTLDTEVTEAAELMLKLGVRHLPVIEALDVAGMVSIRDLLADELLEPEPAAIGAVEEPPRPDRPGKGRRRSSAAPGRRGA